MIELLLLVVAVAGSWILAYRQAGAPAWIPFLALLVIALGLSGTGWVGLTLAAAFALTLIALLGIRPIRQRVISRPLLGRFRALMPAISRTEREALEAGTVGWEGALFTGRPDWRELARTAPQELSPAEQTFLEGPTATLCEMLDDWAITQAEHDLPPEVWRYMKSAGFFGLIIPQAYGGKGFSARAHSEVVMRVASCSLTAAVTVMVPNSLGPAKLLLHYGTQAQKDYYLPRLARGEEVPCFGLTGPDNGSDAAAMPDVGVVCHGEHQGRRVLGIRLNWEKRYITLGPVATVLGLAFRLRDPDHLLGADPEPGITLALIPTDTPGVEIGRRHVPLNTAFQNGPNRGRDVFIPVEWIIGGPERAGQGWRMLMECLADGRGISLPALAVAGSQLATRVGGAYARVRHQFNVPLGRFEGIEAVLGELGGQTYTMDAGRRLLLEALDRGESPAVASAIAKYQLTERLRTTVIGTMDLLGGAGICLGPRNLIGGLYQALPISITVEGANILTRNLIIFGQGAIRCHPYLLEGIHAATADDAQALVRFDTALSGHARHILGNAARSLALALTGARLARRVPPGVLAPHCRQLARLSAAFALTADAALLSLGGTLKRRERISARLADALGELYLASAVVRRYTRERDEAMLPFARWSLERALQRTEESLDATLRSLPARPVAWLVRLLTFPLGRSYPGPTDERDRELAQVIQTPGPARDRLTAGIHQPVAEDAPLARLDAALKLVWETEPVQRRIREALGTRLEPGRNSEWIARAREENLISAAEAARLEATWHARREVIEVDEFPQDLDPVAARSSVSPLAPGDEQQSGQAAKETS